MPAMTRVRVRRAVPGDAEEVLRLRQVMIDSMARSSPATDWHADALPVLRAKLAEPDGPFAAFVVDRPGLPARGGPSAQGGLSARGGLSALVAGTIEYRIGGAHDPHGTDGYVFSVATDPDARRRGHARACMEALLEWFRERGAHRIRLTATVQAEPLYASLGFARRPDPLLELRL
ncbi:GNAT family N-acetyltransferase [Streptomyces prasinus]|uniref:GNAT family N-acetyltransferase n=1 Tax=Streptomyces prasinus TaxID=67345 RepID=UPI00363024BB